MIPSGTYRSLTVTGLCEIPNGATVTVRGPVTVKDGGVLNQYTSSNLTVNGGVRISGSNSIALLGCTAAPAGECKTAGHAVIHGNVTAINALAVYLNGAVVHGRTLIKGGGPGADCIDTGFPPVGHDLVVKDNTFYGGVTIRGWAGCWFGFIRNTVHGSVLINHVQANLATDSHGQPLDPQGPDSTEVDFNHINGNLACYNNTPAAQFGDAGAAPAAINKVTGRKLGECHNL